MQVPSPVPAAIQRGDLEIREAAGLAEEIGKIRQRTGIADPDSPAALRAPCVVDPRPTKAKLTVDSTAKHKKRKRRAVRDAEHGAQWQHRPGVRIHHGRGVPARQMLLGDLTMQGLGMAGAKPPARQHDWVARQFGAERGKFRIGKAGDAGKTLDPPGRQPGRIVDQCPPAGLDQGYAIDRDREFRHRQGLDHGHGFSPADPVQERIAMNPGDPHTGNGGGQQQGQRQVDAPQFS